MTVGDRMAAIKRAWTRRVFRYRATALARAMHSAIPRKRIVNLMVAIPSKRTYVRAMGRRDESKGLDRSLVRRMNRDLNVRDSQGYVRAAMGHILKATQAAQATFYADAILVAALAANAATDAATRLRVPAAELTEARGVLIVGRTIGELLRDAGLRLRVRLGRIPSEAASWASRGKTALEPAIRKAVGGAIDRFWREAEMLIVDYWFAAVQVAWTRAWRVRSRQRRRR